MNAHSFKPKCKHPQTPEGKCGRTKPSVVCLRLEAVTEAKRYMPPHEENLRRVRAAGIGSGVAIKEQFVLICKI